MKKFNSTIINIIYIISTFLLLTCVRFYFKESFTSFEILIFLAFLFFVTAFLIFIPKKWNMIFGSIISFIYAIYLVSQTVYYRGFSYYYRLATAFAFKKELSLSLSSAFELVRLSDIIIIISVFIFQLIFLILFIISYKTNKNYKSYRYKLAFGITSIVISTLLFITFNSDLNKINDVDPFQVYKSDYYIYDSVSSTSKFVKSFGPTTLLYRDIQTLFKSVSSGDKIDEIDDYLNNKLVMLPNDYTGLLKNKSLFIIQAESLTNAFIDPELTPTLYKLKTEGLYFENFNAPLLPGSTSDAEFLANISIVPESEGYSSAFKYLSNEFPTTLAKLFSQNGYKSYAFHNNFGEFYNRSQFLPALGYEFFDSFALGIDTESTDSTTLEAMKYILLENPKYLSFWITFSGHQPYSTPDYDPSISQYKKEVMAKYPTLGMEYITIMCKTMDLDRSIASFLEVSSHAGRYEDTVIVVYGDHLIKGDYLYENNIKNVATLVGKESITVPELKHYGANPLIIYNSDLPSEINLTVSSILDIAPTLYNLFGINYDQKTIVGNDILDPNYSGRFFTNVGYYQTNNFYYDPVNNQYIPKNNYSFNQAQKDISEIDRVREISKYILETNYFATK